VEEPVVEHAEGQGEPAHAEVQHVVDTASEVHVDTTERVEGAGKAEAVETNQGEEVHRAERLLVVEKEAGEEVNNEGLDSGVHLHDDPAMDDFALGPRADDLPMIDADAGRDGEHEHADGIRPPGDDFAADDRNYGREYVSVKHPSIFVCIGRSWIASL
jgi:hypothetical protein